MLKMHSVSISDPNEAGGGGCRKYILSDAQLYADGIIYSSSMRPDVALGFLLLSIIIVMGRTKIN